MLYMAAAGQLPHWQLCRLLRRLIHRRGLCLLLRLSHSGLCLFSGLVQERVGHESLLLPMCIRRQHVPAGCVRNTEPCSLIDVTQSPYMHNTAENAKNDISDKLELHGKTAALICTGVACELMG